VPAVVVSAVSWTSVPVKSPLLVKFTALPLKAEVPVSTFKSVPVVRPLATATFTPDVVPVPVVVPAPAVSVWPLETEVAPRVVVPVNVLLPAIDWLVVVRTKPEPSIVAAVPAPPD